MFVSLLFRFCAFVFCRYAILRMIQGYLHQPQASVPWLAAHFPLLVFLVFFGCGLVLLCLFCVAFCFVCLPLVWCLLTTGSNGSMDYVSVRAGLTFENVNAPIRCPRGPVGRASFLATEAFNEIESAIYQLCSVSVSRLCCVNAL